MVEAYVVGLLEVLNLPNYERDKESAIDVCFVGMRDALKAYVSLQAN